jgi:hypothetical protein
MARIDFDLSDGRYEHNGQRVDELEEPYVRLPKAKVKALLKAKRRNREEGKISETDHTPGKVRVTKINWISRMQRT